jgi:hypothetical protein
MPSAVTSEIPMTPPLRNAPPWHFQQLSSEDTGRTVLVSASTLPVAVSLAVMVKAGKVDEPSTATAPRGCRRPRKSPDFSLKAMSVHALPPRTWSGFGFLPTSDGPYFQNSRAWTGA